MPNTFLGFVLILLTLAPGLAYFFVRSRRHPQRVLSNLQETGAVLLTSVVCILLALGTFGILRIVLPDRTPDLGQLIRDPTGYWRDSYLSLTWWSIVIILWACVVGATAGAFRRPSWLARKPGLIVHESAWHRMLLSVAESQIYARCHLRDGSIIAGYLGSASPQYEESPDRDLVLVPPLREGPSDTLVPGNLSAVILSARDILRIDVAYLPPDTAEEERTVLEQDSHTVDIAGWDEA